MLLVSAWLVAFGALLHLAIPLGGPSWYRLFGAPERLVAMAEAGATRPLLTCVVIAALLGVVAAYGFSGAGVIRRLPLRRPALALIGTGLVVRGLGFVPLALWRPGMLARICGDCSQVNAFLLITSALCLFVGVGYLSGVGSATTATASCSKSDAIFRRSP